MTKTYDAFVYSEGKPVIGEARQEGDGVISINLWLIPREGLVYLRAKKLKTERKEA